MLEAYNQGPRGTEMLGLLSRAEDRTVLVTGPISVSRGHWARRSGRISLSSPSNTRTGQHKVGCASIPNP